MRQRIGVRAFARLVLCAAAGAGGLGAVACAQTAYAQTGAAESGVIDMQAESLRSTSAAAAGALGVGAEPVTGAGRGTISLGVVQGAWDAVVAAPASPIIQVNEDRRIYAVRVRTTMETMFVAPPDDPIDDYYLADTTVFEPGYNSARPNVLRLRALHTEADATLHIVTASGRIYHFYLVARGADYEAIPNVAVYMQPAAAERVALRPNPQARREGESDAEYRRRMLARVTGEALAEGEGADAGSVEGGDADAAVAETGAGNDPNRRRSPEWLRNIRFDPAKLRFRDYDVSIGREKDREIAPVRVFHDATYTYLDFGEKADMIEKPTVRMVMDEIDTPVAYAVTGPTDNIYAVHAIGDFTLRAGDKIVCVRYAGPPLYGDEPDQVPIRLEGAPEGAEAGGEPADEASPARTEAESDLRAGFAPPVDDAGGP